MITHCPYCHTHFRVHAEQLAARAGQVRCGKCSRVFGALDHLTEEIAPASVARPNREFEMQHTDIGAAEPALQLATAKTADVGAQAQEFAFAHAADVAVKTSASAAETPDAATSEPVNAPLARANAKAAFGARTFDFGPGAAAEMDRPARRWPWLLGALLLLLLLIAQPAYHYRTAITLLLPETKPYAAALCAALGCELPLPRRIEQVSIDASDLQADTTNPSVMVLSATIKNRAIFNQQHPMLELTLTDAQDQPVVRRVLAPQDYLGKTVNTLGGFAANTEIAIKVFIEGSQVKATGYRLYLFYP